MVNGWTRLNPELVKLTSQLQNWAFLTYLHGKPKNAHIYPMQKRQNISNTSRHQEVVGSLLNLPCYSHFSCRENFKRSFWKSMIFAVVTWFFWSTDVYIPFCNWNNWCIFRFYLSNSQLKAEINVFFWQINPKKLTKWRKYADFGCKLGKLASNLKMNIIKMGKTLNSEKLMVIFTKI